jgi:Fe-S cluster biogenesis protein NfuA
VAARVERALEGVRPFLAQHDGDVELLDIDADAGAVLLRLLGSCDGCPSSPVTLQHAVEQAILQAAPEITTIDVEEPRAPSTSVPVAFGRKPVYESCPSEVLS